MKNLFDASYRFRSGAVQNSTPTQSCALLINSYDRYEIDDGQRELLKVALTSQTREM
jgi:hypothetical protein